MIGKRIYAEADGNLIFKEQGEYGKHGNGKWMCAVPAIGSDGQLIVGSLGLHDVVEHGDGTITVSPSILVDDLRGRQWHGYLEHGVWREV